MITSKTFKRIGVSVFTLILILNLFALSNTNTFAQGGGEGLPGDSGCKWHSQWCFSGPTQIRFVCLADGEGDACAICGDVSNICGQ